MKKYFRKNKCFKVIPENSTVICEMDQRSILEDLPSGVPFAKNKLIVNAAECIEDIFARGTITAKATCNEKDEYDEEVGMSVASAKAYKKLHMQLAKKYDRIRMLLMEAALVASDQCMNHVLKAQSIENDLVNHYGREPE